MRISREDARGILEETLLTIMSAAGGYPYAREEIIQECGKAFERFLDRHEEDLLSAFMKIPDIE